MTSVADAFQEFQRVVNADTAMVRLSRCRRDLFKEALIGEDDVLEVVPSGSLARGTHTDPINDVDLIVVFEGSEHPEWGTQGTSAKDALDHTRGRINDLLGATNGTYAQEVRLARWRNHAVKCFLDDLDDPAAFTVDAMPALRRDGRLLIPEARSEKWVPADPEYLIREVAKKHTAWDKYAGTVRMLKWWRTERQTKIKSLVMEVLALQFLPTNVGQPAALKRFFVSASAHIDGGGDIVDPAEVCGPIQGDLDYTALGDCLRDARDSAARAFEAQANNDPGSAIARWGEVFGKDFPEPPPSAPRKTESPRPVKDTPQG